MLFFLELGLYRGKIFLGIAQVLSFFKAPCSLKKETSVIATSH